MSPRAQDLQTLRAAGLLDAARIHANAMFWWPVERDVYGRPDHTAHTGQERKPGVFARIAKTVQPSAQGALW